MINNKKISKIFRVMSLFLVITMVVGLLHSERTFAKKKGYDIFKTLDNGYSIVMKLHEYTDPSYGMADKKGKIVLPMQYYEINKELMDQIFALKVDGFLERNDATGYYLIAKTSEIPFTQATFENSKERVRLELAHEYADKQLGITQ